MWSADEIHPHDSVEGRAVDVEGLGMCLSRRDDKEGSPVMLTT